MRSLRDLQEDRNAQPGEVTCRMMSSDIPPLQLLTFRIADVLAEDQQAARTYKLLVKRIEQLLQIVELQVR